MPNKMQNEIEEVRHYTTYKLCTMHGNALLVSSLLLQIQGQPSPAYILKLNRQLCRHIDHSWILLGCCTNSDCYR